MEIREGRTDDFDAGQPIALDLVSITQGEKRIYSFLSAATGLSAELDLGTEHLR